MLSSAACGVSPVLVIQILHYLGHKTTGPLNSQTKFTLQLSFQLERFSTRCKVFQKFCHLVSLSNTSPVERTDGRNSAYKCVGVAWVITNLFCGHYGGHDGMQEISFLYEV